MKQYPIHVVSKLLGISPQGLKFFEKYGLTPFKRSKNGYRSYSILDIQTIWSMREYCNCGFSVADASALAQCTDAEQVAARLSGQAEQLKAQAMQQLQIARKMKEIDGFLRSAPEKAGKSEIAASPFLFAIQYSNGGRDMPIEPEYYHRVQHWIRLMPLADVFFTVPCADFPAVKEGRCLGFCISAQHVGLLPPSEIKRAHVFPSRRCLHTILEANSSEHEIGWYFENVVFRYMTEQRLLPADPPYGRTLRMLDVQQTRKSYVEIWAPLQ